MYAKDPEQAGVKLTDFLFRRVIGRGTYGKVFLIEKRAEGASSKGTGEVYAMKSLDKGHILESG